MDPVTIFFIVASSIGIVSSGIGIGATTNAFSKIGIPPSSMPPPKRNTVVRVGVGLNNVVIPDHPLVDSEGPSPMVVAFDENDGYVGMSNWAKRGHINNGGYFDIEVFHLKEREFTQATNLQIIAQDGPICVAYILETWSDDTHRAWVGNQGPACGYEWGFSNIILGQNQPDFKPCKSPAAPPFSSLELFAVLMRHCSLHLDRPSPHRRSLHGSTPNSHGKNPISTYPPQSPTYSH